MLTTLKRIVQEVNQIPELDEALACVAGRVKDAMQVDSCSIYLADYQQQHFALSATDGLAQTAVGEVFIGFSEGLIGLVGQREEPLNISDAPSHPRFKHYPEVKEELYHAFIGAPIIHQRKVLGVITMQQQNQRRFSEDEEAFLVTLAAQIALEISHAAIRGALPDKDTNKQEDWQRTLQGIPGSTGLAIGHCTLPAVKADLANMVATRTRKISPEITLYRKAVELTRVEVEGLSESLAGAIPDDVRAIFQLYHQLLDANSLGREVEAKIKKGWTAASSLKMVIEGYAAQFANMSDPYMQERAIDIRDLSNRILANMLKEDHEGDVPDMSVNRPSILVAEEISASMLAEFPRQSLQGIISLRGSNNSHAAILARAMGVPAVMGLSGVPLSIFDGRKVLLDGYSGEVIVSPNPNIESEFCQLVDEEARLSEIIQTHADEAAETEDGCQLSLLVNAGLSAELEMAQSVSGDGIGLYRTEIPFMLRERFPSETEQQNLYKEVLASYPGQEVTMRTLDVGGDKPLPYFPITEENPFLGWRGIRLTLDHPEIFLVQIRAMLKASAGYGNLQIMLPMITSVAEVSEARRLIKQAFHEVSEEIKGDGIVLKMPKIGVMLEVPAVLYQLPALAAKVDFFSVGTNDLTQYLLAVDRNNSRVACIYDAYHPAVLTALHQIVQQAEQLGVPVTVCGELAGEPGGAVLLMAMGYRKLSMNSQNLLKVKWALRSTRLDEAQALWHQVSAAEYPDTVRESVNQYLELKGLGGLVRAGI